MKKEAVQKTAPVKVQELINKPVKRPKKNHETALGWFVYISIQINILLLFVLFVSLDSTFGSLMPKEFIKIIESPWMGCISFIAFMLAWYLPIAVLSYVKKNAKISPRYTPFVLSFTFSYPILCILFSPVFLLINLYILFFCIFLIVKYHSHSALIWKMTFIVFLAAILLGAKIAYNLAMSDDENYVYTSSQFCDGMFY